MIRSTDGGATWSEPTIVARHDVGTVHIAGHAVPLERRAAAVRGRPRTATSTPSGRTRASARRQLEDRVLAVDRRRTDLVDSDPGRPVARRHARVHPAGALASDGTIGVSYYDLESATSASPGLTDAFIVHCHSACTDAASWSAGAETKLDTTGPFDMTAAPDAGGYFVGDYEGLTSSGTTSIRSS